jgi:AAA15 family ATPase/GTPase
LRLNEISLTNYKKLKRCSLKFDRNTTIIIGKNNSGKSPIIDSIYLMIKEFKEVDFNDLKDDVNKGRSNHKLEITLTVEIDSRDLKIKRDNSFENDNHIFERRVSCDKFGVGNRESYFTDLQLKEEQMDAELNCLLIKPVKSISEREELISPEHLMNSNFDNNVRNYVYHMYSTQQSNYNKLNNFIKQLFPNHVLIPKIKNNMVELLVETNRYEMTQVDISKMGDGFKNALLILSKILFSGYKTVLLDEPDNGSRYLHIIITTILDLNFTAHIHFRKKLNNMDFLVKLIFYVKY